MNTIASKLFATLFVCTTLTSYTQTASESAKTTHIQWLKIEEGFKKAKKENKKIIIDIYTSWCGWCKVMDKRTFSHPYIIDYINKNYVAIKFNAEVKRTIILEKDTFEFVPRGKRGYNELAVALLNGKLSYPTLIFMDENVKLLSRVAGYQSAVNLEPILKFFVSGSYKTTPWKTYHTGFKGEIVAPKKPSKPKAPAH